MFKQCIELGRRHGLPFSSRCFYMVLIGVGQGGPSLCMVGRSPCSGRNEVKVDAGEGHGDTLIGLVQRLVELSMAGTDKLGKTSRRRG